jgi:hypothetical protein
LGSRLAGGGVVGYHPGPEALLPDALLRGIAAL